ncbi:MAG: thiamine-phosphate kinase [Nitrospinae bacterium CG11_big_fil_rev_8_21_14_0_20_56_8]|nr:MAG: thiamine-phosphate kinase [Nitrospinae bacterium CG11_big_fil_rev_8_21_14_0_20_56_8]
MSDLKKLGEFGFIERIRSRLRTRSPRVRTGIGDDCAVLKFPAKKNQVISTDALIEGVHFNLASTSPRQLGRKTVSVNLSDVAAMGAVPHSGLITLGIPPALPVEFFDQFFKGVEEVCGEYGVEIAGGDTVSSPGPLFINFTILGEAAGPRIFKRAGARPGDLVFVTGALGDSALGLCLLQDQDKERRMKCSSRDRAYLVNRHLDPSPRVREAARLARSSVRVTSMIDISDGLVQDLGHLCESGNVGALLKESKLPKSGALSRVVSGNNLDFKDFVLNGGEDYELLFTSLAEDVNKIKRLFQEAQAPITLIGEVVSPPQKVVLFGENGREVTLDKSMGFNHFKD